MYQIKNESKIELTEKKSKFITRLFKVNNETDAKLIIKKITKEEKGAAHNCYAYRILQEKIDVIERKNDDGEPGGTAGAPMLSVLNGENLVNVLAVTTRYFGGIKLGTGGLVNVYKRGITETLKYAEKEEFKLLEKYTIIVPINKIDNVLNFLKKEKIKVINKDFLEKAFIQIESEKDSIDKVRILISNFNGEIKKTI
jgi:uncharacterized YigZ family protein